MSQVNDGPKYKVGDKVRIVKNENLIRTIGINRDMAGMEITIKSITVRSYGDERTKYFFDHVMENWWIHENMIESLKVESWKKRLQ